MRYERQYDDIINLPHHISKKHPQMSLFARSAQFAPFAALTGYEDAVKETARETYERIEIEDELKSILDSKLQIILGQIKNKPGISFTYFIADSKKDGGKYVVVTGLVKKVDLYNQYIYLADNTEIPINEIIDISGEIFKVFE